MSHFLLTRGSRVSLALGFAVVASASLQAQQFQYQVGLLPGTRWTEGVEAADVDNDGDYDIFFAEGEGFFSVGTQRQNQLLINQVQPSATLSFTDESVARLGVHLSNAKGVFTGDIDDDGWIDAMFANAFNTDPPFLYINRGATQPGFFDEEGSVRGFGQVLSAASGQFGDIDDDGDLDVVMCDSGGSFLAGSGAKPHLYLNDGAGQFTEVTGTAWNPPTKRAHMDVHLVDIDGDWDLDFFGPNRASNSGGAHYLMLNDGTGAFTDISSSLPATSGNVYEAEVGDLDGDTDLDLFFASFSGFSEGAMRNNVTPSGTLSFTKLSNLNATGDDNEIVLIDHDSDGDLDAFVGSLDSREGLWTNNGSAGFSNSQTLVQAVSDPSLDATAVDLDQDGDYDLVTAQGEGAQSTWVNKIYLNQTGAPDTLAPNVYAIDSPVAADASATNFIVHAKMQDQVSDDGKNWVDAAAHFVFGPDPVAPNVQMTDTGFQPTQVMIPAGGSVIFTGSGFGTVTLVRTSGNYAAVPISLTPGQQYEVAFVRPGTYSFDYAGGGFPMQVVVQGAASSSVGLHQGGGQYRFDMGGGPAPRLTYEVEFTDDAGNIRTVRANRIPGGNSAAGVSFCFGDGGVQAGCTSCPCSNDSASGSGGGCSNSNGTSGVLQVSGSPSIAADSLRIEASGLSLNAFALLASGASALPSGAANPCFGLDSGIVSPQLDGLRCVGGGLIRHGSRATDAAGDVGQTNAGYGPPNGPLGGLLSQGGFVAGQTRYFQIFYRENPALGCGRGQNTTQGVSVVSLP